MAQLQDRLVQVEQLDSLPVEEEEPEVHMEQYRLAEEEGEERSVEYMEQNKRAVGELGLVLVEEARTPSE